MCVCDLQLALFADLVATTTENYSEDKQRSGKDRAYRDEDVVLLRQVMQNGHQLYYSCDILDAYQLYCF